MARKRLLTVAPGDPAAAAELLATRLGVSVKTAKAWLGRGAVQANNRRIDASAKLAPGMRVTVREPDEPHARALPLVIVFRDEDLLVVDKPAGLLTQPSPGERTSVESMVQAAHPDARLAHRLDRDASGLVLFTLRAPAHAALQQSIASRALVREYLAVCSGRVDAPREITLRIAPDPSDPSRRRALPEAASGGQAARTLVAPFGPAPDATEAATLLLVTLDTGRTHQIRVHLAAIGHPLLGDRLYGGPPAARLMLHAARLAGPHPRDGTPIELRAAAPPGFRT